MPSEQDGHDDEKKIAAGECPKHGVVAGDCVEWNFPNPAECSLCGSELDVAGMATESELMEHA